MYCIICVAVRSTKVVPVIFPNSKSSSMYCGVKLSIWPQQYSPVLKPVCSLMSLLSIHAPLSGFTSVARRLQSNDATMIWSGNFWDTRRAFSMIIHSKQSTGTLSVNGRTSLANLLTPENAQIIKLNTMFRILMYEYKITIA